MKIDLARARPLADFAPGDRIRTACGHDFELSAPVGEDFDDGFLPEISPAKMLRLGVFGGAYFGDEIYEFPREWLADLDLAPRGSPDSAKNYFGVLAASPRAEWLRRGWILPDDPDPRGWFLWFCRYFLGRRLPARDAVQIKRWRAFRRHRAQVLKNCPAGDFGCRPRQRQALLQWAYDPFF